ncbi:methyltransferase [Legionella waltersii]|uniref:O-methyltransferase n=1 Tax=Legionella waltersii TaxID=66969 RepID=A0A0W1ANQ7_9GAMM|nr:methyltransferase [Legionella waltersii]KTD82882.1 O-methyltransferase [Legionella waltersii]SNV02056.1 O-methyltransferase [Legionella waltersii]
MNNELPAHLQLANMSRAYVVSRAIHAVARLGVADYMSEGPTSIEKLAASTSTIPELLDRVLSFLSDYGVFLKTDSGYCLTSLSHPLQQNHPESMKHVISMVDETWWQAFSNLEDGLKTGVTPFIRQHNTDFFSLINSNGERKDQFKQGMDKLSAIDDRAIIASYPFSQFNSIVDIGYGREHLIHELKQSNPDLITSTFKIDPHQTNRVNTVNWSNLQKAEAYVLKGILHDFNDETTKRLLISLYKEIPKESTLLIAEQAIPESNMPHTNKTMDIIMMVLVGGKQRTVKKWVELISDTGFHFLNAYPSQGLFTIMEFSCKSIGVK